MRKLPIQSSFHGSCRFIGKGEKLMHFVAAIDVNNQIIETFEDINRKLDSDESTKLIKGGQSDPSIWMRLA
jgi:hypothetical protein